MSYRVELTEDAELDLEEIIDYIAQKVSTDRAAHVLAKIQHLCDSLDTMPNRGNYPPELSRVGITHFREVFFKPYRIIYELVGGVVVIHCILDGRRDMQALLKRRLLR